MPDQSSKVAEIKPSLFGLKNANRDFAKPESWGKNQFNCCFPAALACYMGVKGIEPIYLQLNEKLQLEKKRISVENLFGSKADDPRLYFSFETEFVPYAPMLVQSLPRVDLVTAHADDESFDQLMPIEIKLTALPDSSTAELAEDKYSCEIVIRPDTIVYIALSLARAFAKDRNTLAKCLAPVCEKIKDWEDGIEIAKSIPAMSNAIDSALALKVKAQMPLMIQPIWKTKGKQTVLADQAFDMFVWSEFAVTRLFVDVAREEGIKITRPTRTVVWLIKMLYDFSTEGKFDHKFVIDRLTYNTKNDKAFSVPGIRTYAFLQCAELALPRLGKDAAREIILGGGERFLSPERRLDAAILGTPGLF